ncbi:hypothetical protein C8A05DRAFT_39724, partial [Staphylotrichum tortipilum]
MDPLTISTAVLAFLSVSIKVCVGLRQFRGGAAEADTTINALIGDLGALRRVLESMEASFAEAGVDDEAVVRQTGHMGSHWRSLADALNDGHAALADFDELLQALNKQVRVLDEPRRRLRVQSAATKIALFRQQIQAYKDTLQLSLQTIILWNSVSAQKTAAKVLPGLDAIHQEIRRLATNVDIKIQAMQDLMIGAHESSTIKTAERLKCCIHSAASVLSSASTAMLEVMEEDDGGGSISGDLAAKDVAAVLAWIQNNAFETALDGGPTAPDGEGDAAAALAALSGRRAQREAPEQTFPDPILPTPPDLAFHAPPTAPQATIIASIPPPAVEHVTAFTPLPNISPGPVNTSLPNPSPPVNTPSTSPSPLVNRPAPPSPAFTTSLISSQPPVLPPITRSISP